MIAARTRWGTSWVSLKPVKPGEPVTAKRFNDATAPPVIVGGSGVVVRQSGRTYTVGLGGNQIIPGRAVPAVVTGAATQDGFYELAEASPGDTGLGDAEGGIYTARTGGRTWMDSGGDFPAAQEALLGKGVPTGALVLVRKAPATLDLEAATDPPWRFEFYTPGVPFAVDLTQSGGSNGDATTAVSYTYHASFGGVQITDTPKAPAGNRPVGLVTAATRGLLSYGADGTLGDLHVLDEVRSGAECP